MVSADDFGIPYDGSVDARSALSTAINSQPPGTTFTLHPDGLYLTTFDSPLIITAPGVVFDGLGASLFRNVRRFNIKAAPTEDIMQVAASNVTVRNLRLVGFRKDEYTGEKLTTYTGSPAIVGTTVELSTADDEVRLPLVGLDQVGALKLSTNWETPFYFRQVDGLNKFEASLSGTGGAGDALFCLYDDDTNTLVHSQAFSPTTQATFTITFDPTTLHLGTRFRVTIKKVNASGVLTVHSITPYGECGFRRADTAWFNGGNEFSDAIHVGPQVSVSDTLLEDIEIEGPDGDGVNCATTDTNTTIRRVTVRGNGRQAFTLHRSVNYLLEDSSGREVGRSGIDFEPNNVAHVMYDTTVRRVDFLNVRNYGFAGKHWAKNIGCIIEDCTTTNCGMGGFDAGGRPMTITNFFHQGTYRTEADRILNGGHAGIDASIHGIGMNVTTFVTSFGIWLPDLQNKSNKNPSGPTVEYHPSDIHVHDAVITEPYADPYIFIEVPNSTVDLLGGESTGTTSPKWDDTRYDWDSDEITWDGQFLGSAPAFQSDAFQFDAFQLSPTVTIFATQLAPAFTQHVATGRTGTMAQDGPAFTQAATGGTVADAVAAQIGPAFIQVSVGGLTVKGNIGSLVQVFQDDAFQEDAFQTQPNVGAVAPAFTQHLSGAVVPHGATIIVVAQIGPAFTQASAGVLSFPGTITQAVPAFTQAVLVDVPTIGTITQAVPAFTQAGAGTALSPAVGAIAQVGPVFTQAVAAVAAVAAVPSGGTITQIAPAFTQRAREISGWEEWLVTSGTEWLVRV